MYYAKKYKMRGTRVGLFCEDYPSLHDRHISRIQFEFPTWLGKMDKARHEFQLHAKFGGGIIAFRNLDDVSKYLSAEFASVLVDELTKNDREMFDFLNMRLRWPNLPETKFIGATNPGSKGHGWVKKLWISRDFDDENFNPKDFAFIPAKYSDNKYIDPSYEQQLGALPEQLRRAYKDGDWDIFAGQYFPEFRRVLHTCKPFDDFDHCEKFICGDYGFSAPSAIYFCAYDSAYNQYHVRKEIWRKGMTYQALAEEIVAINNRDGKYKARDVVFDPAIWAKKDSPQSGAYIMDRVFRRNKSDILRLHKGDNTRIVGWNRVREVLKTFDHDGVKKGYLQVHESCPNLIRTMPELVHDEKNPEDVCKADDDHGADSLRYGLMWHYYKDKAGKSQEYDMGPGTSHVLASDFDEAFGTDEEADSRLFTF